MQGTRPDRPQPKCGLPDDVIGRLRSLSSLRQLRVACPDQHNMNRSQVCIYNWQYLDGKKCYSGVHAR
jgi:hypothetical protein